MNRSRFNERWPSVRRFAMVRRMMDVTTIEELLADPAAHGVARAVTIAPAGRAPRRAPVYVDDRHVRPDLLDELRTILRSEHTDWPDRTLFTLADARVVGQGSVLVCGATGYRLLRESVTEFFARDRAPDMMERAGGGYVVQREVTRTINRPCLLLQRPWYGNFGHWLVDHAAALAFLMQAGVLRAPHLVVGRVGSPGLQAVMRACITAIMPDAVVHEHPDDELWQFRRLLYVSPLHVPPLFKLPAALEQLRIDIMAQPTPAADYPRRFYISRERGMRNLVNEAEIIEIAASRGFVAVRPETLGFREQAALFAGAAAIMAVKGAALTNILFAPPTCSVFVLSPGSFIDPFFWDIASIRGIAYAELFGALHTDKAELGHNDFYIEPAAVQAMLDAVLPVQRAIVAQAEPLTLQSRIDTLSLTAPSACRPSPDRWDRLGSWLRWCWDGMIEDDRSRRERH